MDRRGFLKRCGLIPFVGSLAALAETEAPESKLTPEVLTKTTNNIRSDWVPAHKLYADIYNNKGEMVAHGMPVRKNKNQFHLQTQHPYKVFRPNLKKGYYLVIIIEERLGILQAERITIGEKQ